MNKSRFDKLRCLGKELQSAIDAKDAELMARLYDDLSEVYMDVFAAEDYSFECLREYCDYSGINVPLVAVCNVPPVARCNVPPQKWLQ